MNLVLFKKSEALDNINELIYSKIKDEHLNDAKYYRYIIENVKKYTSKWLAEELHQVTIKNRENPEDIQHKKKRNIGEFIYFTAGDYGVDLVMENKDTSFKSWTKKQKAKLKDKNEL